MFALVVSAIVSTILVMLRGPVYNDVLRIVVSAGQWVGGWLCTHGCPYFPAATAGNVTTTLSSVTRAFVVPPGHLQIDYLQLASLVMSPIAGRD